MANRQLSVFVIALILTLALSERAMAGEPTVAETKAHIESIMDAGCYRYLESPKSKLEFRVVAGTPAYNVADTTFSYTDKMEGRSPGDTEIGLTMITRFQVALKDLDPKPDIMKPDLFKEGFTDGNGESSISFTCISGQCVTGVRTMLSGTVSRDSPIAQQKLVVPSCGDVERFARAFSHLIKLAGGKPALFK